LEKKNNGGAARDQGPEGSADSTVGALIKLLSRRNVKEGWGGFEIERHWAGSFGGLIAFGIVRMGEAEEKRSQMERAIRRNRGGRAISSEQFCAKLRTGQNERYV